MASLFRRRLADGARNFKGRILIELNLFHRPCAVKKFHTPTSHFHESLHLTDSIQCRIADIDSSKHINITGMSRMGKSTLLVNLFIEHIRRGYGGIFIDPHEDTADQIAKLCSLWSYLA
jgi:ABC-type phosphate/phosphonate transport system ATPase subunit